MNKQCEENQCTEFECKLTYWSAFRKLAVPLLIMLVVLIALPLGILDHARKLNKELDIAVSQKKTLCNNLQTAQTIVSDLSNATYRSSQSIEYVIQRDGLRMDAESVTILAEASQELRHITDNSIKAFIEIEDSAICKKN